MSGPDVRHIALPWVLTLCAVSLGLTAWMSSRVRHLSSKLEVVHKIAMTDHMTGAANRTALAATLELPDVQAALEAGQVAVLSLDLDDFKKLNDEHGHHVGDTALRLAAERITTAMRGGTYVFRTGGDEFLCLIFDKAPREAAERAVSRLTDGFGAVMDLGCARRVVAPSIGIAIAQQGDSWDVILKRADAAMYHAKRGNQPYSFCASTGPALVELGRRRAG